MLRVEILYYYFGFGFTDYACYLLKTRFFNSFHAFKFFQEGSLCFISYAFHIIECRCDLAFTSFVFMKCNGKPVYFILYLFQ